MSVERDILNSDQSNLESRKRILKSECYKLSLSAIFVWHSVRMRSGTSRVIRWKWMWSNKVIKAQTWYLSNLLHQQIFQNLEIYPEKYVICDISDLKYWFFSISIYIIEMLSQFTSLYSHIILHSEPNCPKKSKKWTI